jgi:thioredoxin reductase (NADPH)
MSESDGADHRRLIIAGSGIAGLSAAIYAGRSNNDPLVFEGDEPGGQLTLTTDVENYPGFPEGIGGPELVNDMKAQARRFGAEIENGVVESVEVEESAGPGHTFHVTLTSGATYTADAFIAASGASARTLGIPGEDDLMGYGLSTCATCDGAFFRDEKIVVIGGGDAACEEAVFLTKFASTVHLVHRREEFRAEDYWIDRVMEHVDEGEIELELNTEVTELHGTPEAGIDHVTMVHHPEGHPTDKLDDSDTEKYDFDAGAVFYAIGHTPNTDYLEGLDVETDDEGYLKTAGGDGGGQTAAGVPGLFGAGDVVDYHYQQAITAGGMGCKAAIDADGYLEDLERERAAAETEEPAAAEGDD